jgi:hypothetical protein
VHLDVTHITLWTAPHAWIRRGQHSVYSVSKTVTFGRVVWPSFSRCPLLSHSFYPTHSVEHPAELSL